MVALCTEGWKRREKNDGKEGEEKEMLHTAIKFSLLKENIISSMKYGKDFEQQIT